MENPLVSILMPSFNAEKYIVRAIQSVLNQTYENFELLLLDDSSSDNTLELINTFNDSRIRVYRNPKNIGYLKSCNFLFSETRGDLVAFQDSDDWSYPTRIEKQVQKFVSDKDLVLCATGSRTEVTVDGITIDSVSGISTDEEIKRYINDTASLPFTCATIMVQSKVMDSVGPYREFFDRIGAEHVDWAYMICEKFKSALISEALYFYTFNPNSFTKTATFNIRKRKSLELAKFLHLQRVEDGSDDLQNGLTTKLDEFIRELEKPYLADSSLMLREGALDSLNKRIYVPAILQMTQAIISEPGKSSNWAGLTIVVSRSFVGMLRMGVRMLFRKNGSIKGAE